MLRSGRMYASRSLTCIERLVDPDVALDPLQRFLGYHRTYVIEESGGGSGFFGCAASIMPIKAPMECSDPVHLVHIRASDQRNNSTSML